MGHEQDDVVVSGPDVASAERSVEPDGFYERSLRLEEVLCQEDGGCREVLRGVKARLTLGQFTLGEGGHAFKGELASGLAPDDTDLLMAKEHVRSPVVEGFQTFKEGLARFAVPSSKGGVGREDVNTSLSGRGAVA